MHFHSRLIFFVPLLAAAFSFAPIPAILAQVRQYDPTAVTTGDLSGIPEPHYLVSSIGSINEQPGMGQNQNNALDQSTANVSGTVTDMNGNFVQGVSIVLEGADTADRRTVVAGGTGAFQFDSLKPGNEYHITVGAEGFENWKSPTLILNPGQYLFLQGIKLKLPAAVTNVTVYASPEQIATEQVNVEEKQRVLGIFPNFYVTYDPSPVALTTKLKFRLAYKADTDVMTFVGVAFMAGIYQAGDVPDYGQGWDAYGKRGLAAGYADSTTDIFHRRRHPAMASASGPPVLLPGNGHKDVPRPSRSLQSICLQRRQRETTAELLEPRRRSCLRRHFELLLSQVQRSAALVFQGFLVTTGVRMINGLVQEFVFRKLTPSAKKRD